jgi:hypothetical protein
MTEAELDQFEAYGQILTIRYTAMKPDDKSIPEDPEKFKRELITLARKGLRGDKVELVK